MLLCMTFYIQKAWCLQPRAIYHDACSLRSSSTFVLAAGSAELGCVLVSLCWMLCPIPWDLQGSFPSPSSLSFPVALPAHSHLECFFLTPSISGVRKFFQISPSSLHPSWQNYLLIAFLEHFYSNSSILQLWETESCTLVPW